MSNFKNAPTLITAIAAVAVVVTAFLFFPSDLTGVKTEANDRHLSPATGASEQLISETIEKIGERYLASPSLYSRNTDLNAGTDELIYLSSFEEGAVHTDFKVHFSYKFDSETEAWKLQPISKEGLTEKEAAFAYDFFRLTDLSVRWDILSLAGEYRDTYDMMGSHFYLSFRETGTLEYDYLESRYGNQYYGSFRLPDFRQTDLTSFVYTKNHPGYFEIRIEHGKLLSPLTSNGWDTVVLKYK